MTVEQEWQQISKSKNRMLVLLSLMNDEINKDKLHMQAFEEYLGDIESMEAGLKDLSCENWSSFYKGINRSPERIKEIEESIDKEMV